MKKLNWALRLCKPQFIAHETCYYMRGYVRRDFSIFIKSKEW